MTPLDTEIERIREQMESLDHLHFCTDKAESKIKALFSQFLDVIEIQGAAMEEIGQHESARGEASFFTAEAMLARQSLATSIQKLKEIR